MTPNSRRWSERAHELLETIDGSEWSPPDHACSFAPHTWRSTPIQSHFAPVRR